MLLHLIPSDLHSTILSFLDRNNLLLKASLVCRRWYHLTQTKELYKEQHLHNDGWKPAGDWLYQLDSEVFQSIAHRLKCEKLMPDHVILSNAAHEAATRKKASMLVHFPLNEVQHVPLIVRAQFELPQNINLSQPKLDVLLVVSFLVSTNSNNGGDSFTNDIDQKSLITSEELNQNHIEDIRSAECRTFVLSLNESGVSVVEGEVHFHRILEQVNVSRDESFLFAFLLYDLYVNMFHERFDYNVKLLSEADVQLSSALRIHQNLVNPMRLLCKVVETKQSFHLYQRILVTVHHLLKHDQDWVDDILDLSIKNNFPEVFSMLSVDQSEDDIEMCLREAISCNSELIVLSLLRDKQISIAHLFDTIASVDYFNVSTFFNIFQTVKSLVRKDYYINLCSVLTRRFYHFENFAHLLAWLDPIKYFDFLCFCMKVGVPFDSKLQNILSLHNPFFCSNAITEFIRSGGSDASSHILTDSKFYPDICRETVSLYLSSEDEDGYKAWMNVREPRGLTDVQASGEVKKIRIDIECEVLLDHTRMLTSKHMSKWVSKVVQHDIMLISYNLNNCELVSQMLKNMRSHLQQILEKGTEVLIVLLQTTSDKDWKQMNSEYVNALHIQKEASSQHIRVCVMHSTARIEEKVLSIAKCLATTRNRARQRQLQSMPTAATNASDTKSNKTRKGKNNTSGSKPSRRQRKA